MSDIVYPSFKEFNPAGPASDKGFTINEALFKRILQKEGIDGWNTRWRNTPEVIAPVCKTREELDEAIKHVIELDFRYGDFKGWNLDGIILSYAECSFADFTEVSLRHAIINCGNFENATIAMADLSKADLSFSVFSKADMRGAVLDGALLIGVFLNEARLEGCDLSKAAELVTMDKVLERLGFDKNVIVKKVEDDKDAKQ